MNTKNTPDDSMSLGASTLKKPLESRLIKKYKNRRLYDSLTSRYVTLEEIHQMVVDCIPVKVIDVETGTDVTRSIFLTIVHHLEESDQRFWDEVALTLLLRFYANPLYRKACIAFMTRNLHYFSGLQSRYPEVFNLDKLNLNQQFIEIYSNFQSALVENLVNRCFDQSRQVLALLTDTRGELTQDMVMELVRLLSKINKDKSAD